MSLYGVKTQVKCIIESLPSIPLIRSMGFRTGSPILIQSKQPLGGPVVVRLGNRSFALAREVAEQILVREV